MTVLTNLTNSEIGATIGDEVDQLDQSSWLAHPRSIGGGIVANTQVNLYEAKTQLSSLVERAAKGEEIVIAKAGKPMARLSAVTVEEQTPEPQPFGQNLLGLPKLPKSFYKDIPIEYFLGDEEDPLREVLR
jgi:prevent-host-death family protein